MFKHRKGQAAMEYLVTYGWAMLAIAVIMGVLWNMGVFEKSCVRTLPEQIFSSAEALSVKDWKITDVGELEMFLENNIGKTITMVKFDGVELTHVSVNTTGSSAFISPVSIVSGSGCFSKEFNITYYVTEGMNHTIIGKVSGER